MILSQWYLHLATGVGFILVAGFTLVGFLAGLLGGERGVGGIGRLARDWQER
jgi:hypothetical protein